MRQSGTCRKCDFPTATRSKLAVLTWMRVGFLQEAENGIPFPADEPELVCLPCLTYVRPTSVQSGRNV